MEPEDNVAVPGERQRGSCRNWQDSPSVRGPSEEVNPVCSANPVVASLRLSPRSLRLCGELVSRSGWGFPRRTTPCAIHNFSNPAEEINVRQDAGTKLERISK
jgi:hypothetical protein